MIDRVLQSRRQLRTAWAETQLEMRAASDVPAFAESLLTAGSDGPALIDLALCSGVDLHGRGFLLKFQSALREVDVPIDESRHRCAEWLVAAALLEVLESEGDEESAAYRVATLVRAVSDIPAPDTIASDAVRYAGWQLYAERLCGLDDALWQWGAIVDDAKSEPGDSKRLAHIEFDRLRESVRTEAAAWLEGYRRRHPDDDMV